MAVLAGSAVWLVNYVRQNLVPQIQTQLSETLQRPVEVGALEQFSLSYLRFGASAIPATETDPDHAELQAIEVWFNPWQILDSRSLDLTIVLVKPHLYVEQDMEGNWLTTQIKPQEKRGAIAIQVKEVALRDGDLQLVPMSPAGDLGVEVEVHHLKGQGTIRYGTPDSPDSPAKPEHFSFSDLTGEIKNGGGINLAGEGDFQLQQASFTGRGQELSLQQLFSLVQNPWNLPMQFTTGTATGNVTVGVADQAIHSLDGTVDVAYATVQAPQLPFPLTQAVGKLRFAADTVTVEAFKGNMDIFEGTGQGKVTSFLDWKTPQTPRLELQIQVQPQSVTKALNAFDVEPPVPLDGQIQASINFTGPLRDPQLYGTLVTTTALEVDRLTVDQATSRFQIAKLPAKGEPLRISLSEIRITPTNGGFITGGGDVALGADSSIDLDFSGSGLVAEQFAPQYNIDLPIQVGALDLQAKVLGTFRDLRATVGWQALQADYPARGILRFQGDEVILDNMVASVAGGTVSAIGQQKGDRWLLAVALSNLLPQRLSIDLPGVINGGMSLSGPRNQFDPTAARAQGKILFSEGISLVKNPLTADFVWNGEKVIVREALAEGFRGEGILDVLFRKHQAPTITNINLNVQLRDYLISSLPLGLPQFVSMKGSADCQGTVIGLPTDPVVQGRLNVAGLGINQIAFEPRLTGDLRLNSQGLNLQVKGSRDRVQLALDPNFDPLALSVRLNNGTLEAHKQGEFLQVNIDQFPIALIPAQTPTNPPLSTAITAYTLTSIRNSEFGIRNSNNPKPQTPNPEPRTPNPEPTPYTLHGIASGQFALDLDPLSAVGTIAIDKPVLGHVQGKQFQTQFRLNNDVLTLGSGSLTIEDSRFNFDGRVVLAADPQFKINVGVSQGRVQDVLHTLQWFDLVDVARGLNPPIYGSAADVQLPGIGDPSAPLQWQLYRFAEIKTQIARTLKRRQQEQRLPRLRELEGRFDGTVALSGSFSKGLQASFQFGGSNWTWGDYTAKTLIAQGEFANGQLVLQPVRVEAKDTLISFTGSIGGKQQSGQLQVEHLPLELVRDFVDVPLDVQGQIDATATLAGSLNNPQLLGELNLVNGTLSRAPLVTKETGFNYLNGRLGFGSILEVDANQTEPVSIQGSIPLPFGNVKPINDKVEISLRVKNEGIALLNLLTQDKLKWLGGQGDVTLDVAGTVEKPVATGLITLNGATMTADFIPEGELISNLTGTIRFVQDRINVEQVNGLFSEGQVSAQGILPIVGALRPDDPDRANPLLVSFQNLNLNLPGLYRGGAGGQVQVEGSIQDPRLAGAIQLSEGDVIIPDAQASAAGRILTNPESDNDNPNVFRVNPIGFDNLRLQLQRNVRVAAEPLYSFLAEGDLVLNGSLNDLKPNGTIELTRGQVNLFTTNFVLARRYNNVAVFRPSTGMDPDWDVRMVASVTEVSNRAPAAGPLPVSEIADSRTSDFGELETIRIRAEIQGPASKLLSNLRLTSRPARTESELYALMGGSFITTLGQGGDSTLALANLAGSALINNLQARINNVLRGPIDFRLFPTVVESNNRRDQAEGSDTERDSGTETLALGAEVGINLTNSLSFSVLRLLTIDLPTRFNVRYQLNDNLQLRATSDLQGDNRFVVEYEARF
jgi:translocation and assembly module TamB